MTNNKMTFEEYLEEVHAANYNGTDDNMPDALDAWVSELSVEDVMDYAEVFGKKKDGYIAFLENETRLLMKDLDKTNV